MATANFMATADSNDLQLSYAPEADWGVPPAGAYQNFRAQSESFKETENFGRPDELGGHQASAASTQDISAAGGLQFGISFANADPLWAMAFCGEWTAALAIDSDAVAVDGPGKQFVGPAGTFNAVLVGQWMKSAGYVTAANNGFHRVTAKAPDGSAVTVGSALVTEAAGADVAFRGSLLRNANIITTATIEKRFAAGLGFAYAGTLFTGGQINAARGQFFSGTLDAISKAEAKAPAALGNAYTPAPAHRVMDTVTNMKAMTLAAPGETPLVAKVLSINTQFQRQGAALAHAMGDAAAQGVGTKGKFTGSGDIEMFFKDYSAYDAYKARKEIATSYLVQDVAGNAYVVTMPVVTLRNPTITAGGPSQPVTAKFQYTADPDPVTGCTMQIDRFAA